VKIIFNSDLLYANSFIRESLPRQLHSFLVECREHSHEVIIPETTLLEFEKKQAGFLQEEVLKLEAAKNKLALYKVSVGEFDSTKIVPNPNLVELIQNIIPCAVQRPTENDYSIAHRKACLRESPHPPEIKSDEMRDLVIWEISLRISRENGGALLMSRDEVHAHHRGDLEASESFLIRSNSFERAYESLSIQTDSAKRVQDLLGVVWKEIVSSELPLVDGSHIIGITSVLFEDRLDGSSQVECSIKLQSGDGKEIKSNIEMRYWQNSPYFLMFHNVKVGESNLEDLILEFDKPEHMQSDVNDRRESLKRLLRGEL